MKGVEAVHNNEHEATASEVAKSEQCDSDEGPTHLPPEPNDNVFKHQLRTFKDQNVKKKDDKHSTPEWAKAQRLHSGKPVLRLTNVKVNEVYTSDYDVKRIIERTKKIERTKNVVECYEYISEDVTVEPPKHLTDHFIARYWRQMSKRTTITNAQASEKLSNNLQVMYLTRSKNLYLRRSSREREDYRPRSPKRRER